MARDAARALDALLERERAMLRSGSVAGLDRIGAEKERLARLIAPGTDPRLLARLRRQAAENAGLMRAAAEGIASAIATLRAIREGAGTLRTYGSDGAERRAVTQRGSLERRA